jgi:hypothetical protein
MLTRISTPNTTKVKNVFQESVPNLRERRQMTRNACWQIHLLRRNSTTCTAACSALYLWAMVPRPRATTPESCVASYPVISGLSGDAVFVVAWKLEVLYRESLVSFERNSVSSFFDKLLDANTVGVRDIILLLQVLHGIRVKFTAPMVRVMFQFECKILLFLYVFSHVNT